jgi:hypothetical protein
MKERSTAGDPELGMVVAGASRASSRKKPRTRASSPSRAA